MACLRLWIFLCFAAEADREMTMKSALRTVIAVLAGPLLLGPLALVAHDTWLVPVKFGARVGESVLVKLATSEAFPTSEGAPKLERVELLTIRDGSGVRSVSGYRADGTFLVADVMPRQAGHSVVVLALKPNFIELKPQDFNEYLRHEELKPIMDARKARGQWDAPGRERYRKIAKAILCVGEAKDRTYRQPEGLWLEVVPRNSPCGLRVGDSLTVQILFQGKPLERAAVAAGYTGATGHSYPVWVRTPENGQVRIALDRPGLWFVRVLHMVPSQGDPETDWHSAFSTLTFEVQP
jgi:uncharacterized GH25 family protein